jgi:hypothetical protein
VTRIFRHSPPAASEPVPGPHPQYPDIRLRLLGTAPCPRPSREVPGLVPAYPAAEGLMFRCQQCGSRTETRVDGGTARPGDEMTLACGRRDCAAVTGVLVRSAMFGPPNKEENLWLSSAASLTQ